MNKYSQNNIKEIPSYNYVSPNDMSTMYEIITSQNQYKKNLLIWLCILELVK